MMRLAANRRIARWSFLGDLVDRGPDSAGVIRLAREWGKERREVRYLAGNHEEMFLESFDRQAKCYDTSSSTAGKRDRAELRNRPQGL